MKKNSFLFCFEKKETQMLEMIYFLKQFEHHMLVCFDLIAFLINAANNLAFKIIIIKLFISFAINVIEK